MEYYQHRFESVEDYLHHRPPYLLVERIVSLSSNEIETEKYITGDEFYMKGHFPGAAVFPGAMMQELSTQSAGILIAANYNPMQQYNTHDPEFNPFALGVLVRVKDARFKGFARPGDKLLTRVTLHDHTGGIFDFCSTITVKDSVIMRNSFRLANIKSSHLQGS